MLTVGACGFRWLVGCHQVAKAIDVVDRITLRTGFFLSREPLARLLFLLYVPTPLRGTQLGRVCAVRHCLLTHVVPRWPCHCLSYLLVLHLWALFILAFHTHRLDHPSSSSVASPPFVQSRS